MYTFLRHFSLALATTGAVSLALPVSAEQSAVSMTDATARFERLAEWMKAAAFHEPGTTDDWASRVGSWTSAQVGVLWVDTNLLVQMMRNPAGVAFNVRPYWQSRTSPFRYSPSQIHRMRVLACAAAGTIDDIRCAQLKAPVELDDDLRRVAQLARTSGDGDNYLLRRGALLHADIAMLGGPVVEPIGPVGLPGPQQIRLQTGDGLPIDFGQLPPHWELARMLLDYVRPRGAVSPAPGRDDMVRLWYRATSSWMQAIEQHDTDHLDRARAIFPTDPDILFLSGCQHEVYAGAPVQSTIRMLAAPTGVRVAIGSERSELHQAESFFRRALEANPTMSEGHLRYGRVLFLLERYADAVGELRRAIASSEGDEQRYYGELFLGAAEAMLRNVEAAREAFGRAARLYPTAQSPRIALSELARRLGDRRAALREIQPVFDPPAMDSGRDDPWWRYYVVQARNAEALLDDLRQPFRLGSGR